MKCKVCDLILNTCYAPAGFAPFVSEGGAELTIDRLDAPVSHGSPEAVHPDFSVYRTEDGWLYETPAGEQLTVDGAYARAGLYLPDGAVQGRDDRLALLLRICVECRLIRRGYLSLHAACVTKDGRAVAFTGPSGTGKSTRARRWVEALDARWLSGDRPALCVAEKTAHGVPWDGKEQIFRPEQAPLEAVLEVRRGAVTRVRRLTAPQARRILTQQVFVPMWDSDTAARAMKLVRDAARTLPVCRVICGPDAADAAAVYGLLFRRPEEILPPATDWKLRQTVWLRAGPDRTVAVLAENPAESAAEALAMNETAAFCLKQMQTPICREDLLALLCSEYDAEPDTARRDLEALRYTLNTFGLMREQD